MYPHPKPTLSSRPQNRRRFLDSLPVFLLASLGVSSAYLDAQNCRLVADISPGTGASSPSELYCAFGDTLFFSASNSKIGQEPWVSKTGGKPILLKDIRSSGGSSPRDFIACGSRVFFTADDGKVGRELWVTDGTSAGTHLVQNINGLRTSSDIRDLACIGDKVVFRATDVKHGSEIWVSDGSSAGTVLLKDIRPGTSGSDPKEMTTCGGRVFFNANDGKTGWELWVTDGTPVRTVQLKDINAGVNSSSPQSLHCHFGTLFFAARAGRQGIELFQSDGTRKGTVLVKDINTSGDSTPRLFTSCGNKLFFVADTFTFGSELFVHDATSTRLVRDIRSKGSSSPDELVCANGTLFFTASNAANGDELWRSDGTTAGTVLVKDIRPGSTSTAPTGLTSVGARVYFQANDGKANGLWVTDGSTAGTKRICPKLTFPRNFALCDCDLFFSAYTAQTAHELYAIDAPGASVRSFAASCAPQGASMSATLPVLGKTMTLSGKSAPKGGVGFVFLGTRAPLPQKLPNGCNIHVQPILMLTVVTTPKWSLSLPIPNFTSLDGACIATQTLWINIPNLFPIHSTNALLLGLGH